MDLACIMKIFEITKIAERDIEWIFQKNGISYAYEK